MVNELLNYVTQLKQAPFFDKSAVGQLYLVCE